MAVALELLGRVASGVRQLFSSRGDPDALRKPEWNEALARFVQDEFTRRQQERRPWELQWRLNAEFLHDNQFLDINPVTQTLVDYQRLYWWQEREPFNHIAPIYETRVARLSRSMPRLKVRPASPELRDLHAAKVSSQWLQAVFHDDAQRLKHLDLVSWLELEGTVFLQPEWDPKRGRVILEAEILTEEESPEAPAGMPSLERALGPVDAAERKRQWIVLREGDLTIRVIPANRVFPDSVWREGVRQCRSIMLAEAVSVQEIWDTWRVTVKPETGVAALTLLAQIGAAGGLGYNRTAYRTAPRLLKDHVVLKTYLEWPTARDPEGRIIIAASDKTLYAGPLPYLIGDDGQPGIPLVRIVSIHRPGCFFGKSVIERLIPIQRRYNALRNRKAEYLNRVAIGVWMKPKQSTPQDLSLTGPGEQVEYVPIAGHKPEILQWPELPQAFQTEEHTLLTEFTIISGVSEFSRYSRPPGEIEAGVALALAQEQDDTRLSTTASRIEEGYAEAAKIALRLARQFVKEPRMLRTVGADNLVEVVHWSASDLRSDDVVVEAGVNLAETPAQRRQMVFDLLRYGLYNDPETGRLSAEGRRKLLEHLQFGHWETGADEDDQLHRARAQRESLLLQQGVPVPVADYDDHFLHVQQHNRFRLTAEYEALLATPAGQAIDAAFRAHIEGHLALLQQAALQMVALQASAPGPGGPPAPPAPAEAPMSEALGG